MNVTAGAKTDPGQRLNNEDHFAIVDTRRRGMRVDGALVIADGMGGRSFGEQAAAAAVETVEETLAEMLDSRQDGEVVIADALASALRKANSRVYELARADEERKGMGTTCVAAVIEGETLYVAHAGDSRAYLLREGALRQLTDDHSYVAEQVRAGAISEEGARKSRFRNIITRAVGIEPTIDAEVSEFEARPGDQLLLCTDGLSNMLTEEDIAHILAQFSSPQAAADRLVQMANKSGGRDNITAVVARLQLGTRTQRLHTAEFVRPGAAAEADFEPEHVMAAQAPAVRRRRPSLFWPLFTTLLLALSAGTAAWFGSLLLHDGYRFTTTPPFAIRPQPPAPPRPPDPAQVAYAPPAIVYYNPVRGDFLNLNAQSGLVTVAALSGSALALTPDGQVKYKYQLPSIHAQAAPPPGALGAAGATVHTATDPKGDLYVSDALAKTVSKYLPNGAPLGLVAHSTLTNPQAIAAAPDGTIYLVDANRLKVLHAHSSTRPLPPIPSPKLPTPPVQPTPPPAPLSNVPVPVTYGRHGRHYGFGYHHYGFHHYGHHSAVTTGQF